MKKTFFFYDLETSGLNPRSDRIMQFAGQRTDEDLNPLGEPVNLLVKMTLDALPSPAAILVTKITPQMTLMDGISEAEFCRFVSEEVFIPGTIALGYNTVRFDDEFMRATFWRNFYDPYEWEWQDNRSRWDLLDVVRLVRALRPEGINWPMTAEGKPTNRLELITKLNGLKHAHAHDALSDVCATIAVARLIKEKQPEMFDYLLKMRSKREVLRLVNLENPRPFVYASGHYSSAFNKTSVVLPIAAGRNSDLLVFDLRYDVDEVEKRATSAQNSKDTATRSPNENLIPKSENSSVKFGNPYFPVIKEFSPNKCPAVAPLGVLDKADGWQKIGLSREQVEQNLQKLLQNSAFVATVTAKFLEKPDFPPAIEPEQALYNGFLSDRDRIKVAAVRNADRNRLADFHPDFSDPRLSELLLHYKGRNFPDTLAADEAEKFEAYRRARLERLAPNFLKDLSLVAAKDDFIAEELKLYFESLL